MPKAIQIRDVPVELHRELRARAAAAGMSLSDYLRRELTRIAERPTNAEVLARAGLRGGGGFSNDELIEAIRAGREK